MKAHIWSRPDTSATSTAGDEHWGKDAPCRAPDPETWFGAQDDPSTALAKSLCKACPVIVRCRVEVEKYERSNISGIWGVWAGETADERSARRRKGRNAA